jgi:two-component system, cell cycle sensor histidine kinase and response regulator CckA
MESELERHVRERTRELEDANRALRQSEQMLATELNAAQRLQRLATQLINAQAMEALYEEILDTAVAILHADFASIRAFDPERGIDGELRLLSHRGFNATAAKRWEWVSPATRITSGEALRTGRRVAVPDVRNCEFMAGSEDLEASLGAGIEAAQSTPLVSRSGALLGMLSTHWREPHELSASELRTLDVLARLAADLIERSQAEEKLRESEERFRNMADAAPVMIWASGPDKLCTFFNKPWLDFTGRTMEQERGNGWADSVHPEDLGRCLAIYTSSFDAHRCFKMEYRLRRGDGEYRWVLDNGAPLYNASDFVGYIGSCLDITEQKLIEERLRASELRLMEAQRLAKVGSWERHIEAGWIHWSDEMLRILGLPNGAPSNFPAFLSCVHPKDREKILEADVKVHSSIAPVDVEYRIIRPDGELRFVRSIVEAIRNDQGAPVRLTGATQDVTEQVQAQELLRKSEERLKNAERLAHLGHWDWDLKSNQVTWSEEMFHIFGQPRDYIPSYEEFLQMLILQDRARVQPGVTDRFARKSGFSSEVQIARPNGDLRTISSIVEVTLDEEGLPIGMFGACQDITDVRRAQEESFARQKLESVGTLASGIAHDFNNLLGGVLAQAELAEAEWAAGSYPEEELKGIRNVAIRGSEIVRQLMIYAGKESGVVGLVDISRIVKEMLELLKVSVSKRATLETDLGQNLPAVRGSAAQLRQVVMNLVTNASEAIGDRDGVIRVTTRCVKVGRNSSGAISDRLDEGNYVQLEVSDTGSGMSQETQARVFDPFFTTKSAGHGLGLAVVQGIVRGLQGGIRVASEPDGGATFHVLLPPAETVAGATSGLTSGVEELAGLAQVVTLLVVEDEVPLRHSVAKMLRKAGFEVFEAADGFSAIELLRANGRKINAMLLDVTLPGASSHEIVTEAAKARPDIRVILTSAYSQEMIAGVMSAAQICGFIRKPFEFRDLVKTLRNTLSS